MTAANSAARGRVNHHLADACLNAAYFARWPPKSTDGPAMIDAFLQAIALTGLDRLSLADQLATACSITSRTIFEGIARFCHPVPHELIVSGGGTENRALMHLIQAGARQAGLKTVCTTDHFGIPSAAKEAIAFAILAAATLDGFASNVPGATGARHRVVLGSITPTLPAPAETC